LVKKTSAEASMSCCQLDVIKEVENKLVVKIGVTTRNLVSRKAMLSTQSGAVRTLLFSLHQSVMVELQWCNGLGPVIFRD
jgi:hypothetical protein